MVRSTLSGELFYIFLISIVDAAILSWVALRWYQRAVARRMGADAQSSTAQSPSDAPASTEPHAGSGAALESLRVAVFGTGGASNQPSSRREWPAGWRRLAVAYCVGAAMFSSVVTAAATVELESRPLTTVFGMWWINAWPIVPTLILLLLLDRRAGVKLVAAYLVCGSAALATLTLVVHVSQGSLNVAPLTNMYWLNVGIIAAAWWPLLLVLMSGWHRIRGVMPLALASTLFFGFGLLVFREAITRVFNTPALRDILLEVAVRTSTAVAYYSLYMIVALPAGWLAWRFLAALGRAFEHKQFSDMQLVVDCWWLIVTADTIATHLVASFGLTGIGVGLAAFAAYRIGTFTTLRLMRRTSGEEPTHLLLLRVFGHQSRTESLFDRIAQRWRFRGPVQLIAGVDLAMRTADPGDMLAFVGGRLRDVYVSSASELPVRIARLDMDRDPDGRFRVNDLYCANETWKETLLQLVHLSDIVVMDLRGFTDAHSGCVYELEQLVTRLPTEAIVLVCDSTTDYAALARLLDQAWRAAATDTGPREGRVSLVRVDRDSPTELDTLMERLVGTGVPQQVLTVSQLPALA
jgi:hypothetical protein